MQTLESEFIKELPLRGKVALITGGNSAIALQFAREGADVAIVYHDEDTLNINPYDRQLLMLTCDADDAGACKKVVDQTISRFGKIDIVVNNGTPHILDHIIPHLAAGSSIINTASSEAFTIALSVQLMKKGIRVNGVLTQPAETAPLYTFLASEDAAFISGQIIF
jgi:hypothetical protein